MMKREPITIDARTGEVIREPEPRRANRQAPKRPPPPPVSPRSPRKPYQAPSRHVRVDRGSVADALLADVIETAAQELTRGVKREIRKIFR
jgi:hypothetical protein